MGLLRRTFTRDVKMAAVQRLESGASIAEVARAFEVNPNVLHRWRREFRQGPGNAFPGFGKRRWDDTQQAKLERKIGQQTLEIDFLKGCLQRIEEQRMLQALTGYSTAPNRSMSADVYRPPNWFRRILRSVTCSPTLVFNSQHARLRYKRAFASGSSCVIQD